MNVGPLRRAGLSSTVRETLSDLSDHLVLDLRLWVDDEAEGSACLWPHHDAAPLRCGREVPLRGRPGRAYRLEIATRDGCDPGAISGLVVGTVSRILEFAQEVTFFTDELSERYEEINLLYSISETLGSVLVLDDAARRILEELCDVLGARRGALWVAEPDRGVLVLRASVGEEGLRGPLDIHDSNAVTAKVYRSGRPTIAGREQIGAAALPGLAIGDDDSILAVPIRYTPPSGESRTVGVINLIGRRNGGSFTAADQKLLAAVASQVGAALENNRLVHQSLQRERMAREMELAHDLQQKLLPPVERFDRASISARVEPAELVGGDFYQVLRLPEGRIGVMIGDVSTHGFPAALIMALTMSAASIYATEHISPARVLREMDDALKDELETTEMYLTLFYGVLDPKARTLTYANAGHPHAFLFPRREDASRLLATDPPVGFAGPDAYSEACVKWDPDADLLLLFTDGLSDTLTSEETPDGEAVVLETIRAHRTETPESIVDALFERARCATPSIPSDDRTALVVTGV
ncbi:MAG: SpoIIE family protein phosphatase [Longimicrobiales bacterium]|nr:SpoIIE family protein phosphatase [Longimicrobiales bacterium]